MMEFVSVIALILSLLIGYVVAIRVARPHSKRMGRNGAQQSAPTPTGAGAPALATAPKGRFAWIAEYLWTVVLIIAGLVIFFQGVYSSEWQSPSFSSVGSFSWNHWLQLLVLWGIGAALLKLHKKELGAAEPVLQSTLIAATAIAFLICPVIGWFEGSAMQRPATAQVPAQTICPDVTSRETRECLISNEWSNWVKFADGSTDNGKQICFPLGIQFERKDEGATFWRFKTSSGKVVVKYRLFSASEQCSSVVL